MKVLVKKQKRFHVIEISLAVGLACFLLWGFAAQHQQQALAEKVVRLHILANSDSEEDQALKLRVRDQVLARATEILQQSKDRTEAEELLRADLPELETIAEDEVRAAGYSYNVSTELEKTAFPTREYDGFTLPAGEYLALRIIIGAGAGHNWWCVVFPPLCTQSAEQVASTAMASGLSEDDVKLITGDGEGYVLKFKSIELWEQLKEKLS